MLTSVYWQVNGFHFTNYLKKFYSYLSVSIGFRRAAFDAGYMLKRTPHAIENETIIIILLMSTAVGISLK